MIPLEEGTMRQERGNHNEASICSTGCSVNQKLRKSCADACAPVYETPIFLEVLNEQLICHFHYKKKLIDTAAIFTSWSRHKQNVEFV